MIAVREFAYTRADFERVRRLIHDRAGEQEVRDYALKNGMRSLRQDGMRWVASGTSTLEEVLRVTRD